MSEKRPHDADAEANGAGALVIKRQKGQDGQIVPSDAPHVTKEGVRRTSRLLAPIMLLSGHQGEAFSVRFSRDGENIASGSHDKSIFLWQTYGECRNYDVLAGHKNAVLEVHWTADNDRVVSCSADKSVRAWDAAMGRQIKKMSEHTSIVNSCCPIRRGPPLLLSCSDDCTTKVWDLRAKRSVQTLPDKYPLTSVAFAEAGDQVYAAGIENVVKVWDLRNEQVALRLVGHSDTITGMSVKADGTHLLTNSMDNTLRMWDMRPFAPANRCAKVFTGHQHNFEKNLLRCDWSPDGSYITAGSADRMVYVWDVASRQILYKLPGHSGSVNEAVFHPTEPIIASCSSDRQLYLGELAL